jgi:hypothetical protein
MKVKDDAATCDMFISALGYIYGVFIHTTASANANTH